VKRWSNIYKANTNSQALDETMMENIGTGLAAAFTGKVLGPEIQKARMLSVQRYYIYW
jgi:hypothetical protein